MPEIVLSEDRIGKRAVSGVITAWPKVDAFGRAYTRTSVSFKYLSDTEFVVLPPGGDSDENEFITEAAFQARGAGGSAIEPTSPGEQPAAPLIPESGVQEPTEPNTEVGKRGIRRSG